MKSSKLKWNHELLGQWFHCKVWTFHGLFTMIYKSIEHGMWSYHIVFNCQFALYNNKLEQLFKSNNWPLIFKKLCWGDFKKNEIWVDLLLIRCGSLIRVQM